MPTIDYINGRLQFDARDSSIAAHWMGQQPWLQRHPNKGGVWYCYPFRTTVSEMRQAIVPVWNQFTVSPKALKALQSFEYIRTREIPLKMQPLKGITLEYYQEEALHRMLTHHDYCIFLGPGTGKTLIALTYLNSINSTGIHLVVTPKKVIPQYAMEARKHLDASWEICEGVRPRSSKALVIINYEALPKFQNIGPLETMLLDESHRAKSPSSKINTTLCKMGAVSKNIFMFTGTPSQNHTHDIFAQLKIFNENLMGAKTYFMEYFYELDSYNRPIRELRSNVLLEILDKVSYGGKTEDLLTLPNRFEHKLRCRHVDPLYEELRTQHVAKIEDTFLVCDTPAKLGVKLRQIPNGHVKLPDGTMLRLHNPKEKPFLELIPTLAHGIIYTQFDADITLISEMLDKLNRTYVIVNGKTKDVGALIDSFKTQAVEFLVIQAQSGNAGLDLTVTNNIVFYSLPLSSIVYDQCLFRVWRRGQTLDCHYYYLLVPNTVEHLMLRNLKEKKRNTDKILGMYKGDSHE